MQKRQSAFRANVWHNQISKCRSVFPFALSYQRLPFKSSGMVVLGGCAAVNGFRNVQMDLHRETRKHTAANALQTST